PRRSIPVMFTLPLLDALPISEFYLSRLLQVAAVVVRLTSVSRFAWHYCARLAQALPGHHDLRAAAMIGTSTMPSKAIPAQTQKLLIVAGFSNMTIPCHAPTPAMMSQPTVPRALVPAPLPAKPSIATVVQAYNAMTKTATKQNAKGLA